MTSADVTATPQDFESAIGRRFTAWDIWAGLLPLLALTPMLFIELQGLWTRPHMHFVPMTFVAVACLAFGGWQGGESLHPLRRWVAIGGLIVATLIYGIGVWQFSPWLCHVAASFMFCAWALGRCGNTKWPWVVAWTALLLTTLPLPLSFDLGLMHWLQAFAALACGKALDALGIPYLLLSNFIQTEHLQLIVEDVCSGWGSVYALFSLALLLLILHRRSLMVAILSLISVPIWIVIGNFLQLLTIVVARENYGHDLSMGTYKFLLGSAAFGLAGLCFWLTQIFLARMLQPVPIADPAFGLVFSWMNNLLGWPWVQPLEEIEPEDEDDRANFLHMKQLIEANQWHFDPMVWTDKVWAYRTVLIACGILLLASVGPAMVVARGGLSAISFGLPRFSPQGLAAFPPEAALPEQSGEFQRTGYRRVHRSPSSSFGEHSVVWEYAWHNQLAQLSLDFPFASWPPLANSYRSSGWGIKDQEVFDDDPNEEPWPWEELELVNDLGGNCYVYFCAFTADLQAVTNLPGRQVDLPNSKTGLLGALELDRATTVTAIYQIQLYFESGMELDRSDRSKLRDRFLELRRIAKDAAAPAVKSVNE